MQKPFAVQWELNVGSSVSHLFNHKVAVFYLSKTLLPLQHFHLTYISKLTGRNGRDKILNGTDRIRAAYLFIYWPGGRNAFYLVAQRHVIGVGTHSPQ